MDIKEIKEYLRVTGEDEEDLISSLFLASQEYIKNGTGIEPETVNQYPQLQPLYNLSSKMLISHWYENRLPEMAGTNFQKLSFSLETIFLQLEAEYLKIQKRSALP